MGTLRQSSIFWITTTILLIAAIFTGIHIYLVHHIGPAEWTVSNRFMNVWFSAMLAFFALQGLIVQSTRFSAQRSRTYVIVNNGYFILMAVIFLEIAASWDVYGRGDIGLWSVAVIIMCIFNVYCLSSQGLQAPIRPKKRVIHPMSEQSRLISDSSDDIETIYEGKPDGRSYGGGWLGNCLFLTNTGCKLLVLICASLLMKGAISHGMGIQHHAPRNGHFLELTSGVKSYPENQSIYYRCEGNNTSTPTIILESEIWHGMAEWFGLFHILVQGGNRVCIWDKPGIGFSDYAYPQQLQPKHYYARFLQTLSETEPDFAAPYIFVAAGSGGAKMVHHLAQDSPSLVKSVVLLDPLMPNFSRRSFQMVKNVTEQNVNEAWQQVMQDKRTLIGFFNSLAVPFGIMGYIIPPKPTNNKYWTTGDRLEQRWQAVTEKQWTIKYWELAFPAKSWPSTLRLTPEIAVHVILSALNDDQVEHSVCRDVLHHAFTLSDEDCAFKKAQNRLALVEKRSLTQNGGRFVECTETHCGLDYFLYEDPAYTADQIRQLIASNVNNEAI